MRALWIAAFCWAVSAAGMLLPSGSASAQVPCGGLLQPACPPPALPPPPPPPAPEPAPAPPVKPPGPITDMQYRAIHLTITASLPLDRSDATALRAAYRKSCQKLSTTDPLLRTYRGYCTAAAGVYDAGARRCHTRDGCLTDLATVVNTNTTFRQRYVDLNRVVKRTVTDTACRAALQSPKGYLEKLSRIVAAYATIRRGVKANSSAITARGDRQLRAVLKQKSRSNKRQLRDLEQHCQP